MYKKIQFGKFASKKVLQKIAKNRFLPKKLSRTLNCAQKIIKKTDKTISKNEFTTKNLKNINSN